MFNHSTRHLSGQQRYVVDKKINDEKKRKEEIEKSKKLREQLLDKKKKNITADIFQEIKDALEEFMNKNPKAKPEIVINPEVFEGIKKISPQDTYNSGNSTTIFGQDFSVEDSEEYISVREYKKK
ncbi:hypothetical protein ACQVQ8_15335 [Bacillus cereus]|uniref:hypothetical protein n=1 Tax=Bacillus cereus TaxID=1396 RepID=UPI003D650623